MDSRLEILSSKVLTKIISYLPLNDIFSLMTTSEILYNICNSNDVWKSIFNRFFKSFCLDEDFNISNTNNWRELCFKVMIENADCEEFQAIMSGCGSDEDEDDGENLIEPQLRPSIARTNLFESIEIHDIKSDDDSLSSESSSSDIIKDLIDIKEIHPTVSSSSNESFENFNQDISSKTNLLLVPTSSAASFNENVKCHKDALSSPDYAQTCYKENKDELNLGFTRSELIQRLQNLVKLAHRNFNGDVESLLPATKYGKYALRYRDE